LKDGTFQMSPAIALSPFIALICVEDIKAFFPQVFKVKQLSMVHALKMD